MQKIVAVLITAIVVIVAVLAVTPIGHVIDAATQHFMLYYAGVLALVGLTGSVLVSLLATDRIIMTPGHRVMAQAVHRAFAFGTLAFLIIHIVTEILAQRSHVIDAVVPFLSPYRTFYIGLGTIASDLIVLLVITGIMRKRFTGHGKAWQWRAIHYSSYVAFVFGILHGLLGGRAAKPYVDWSYGFAIAVTALGIALRFLAISLRPKESLSSSPVVDRAKPTGSSPLRTAAMSMAQAQLGATVQVLPASMGARGTGIGTPGPLAALPAPGWSPSSGPLPALGPAPAHAGSSSFPSSDTYRELGFTPLGAPPYGDDVPTGMRGRPYLSAEQSRQARQPLYEPGYDGPPRFAGAPRGYGDIPQDDLSSYPYGPQDHRPQSAPARTAISAPPREGDRGSGPMPRLGTGPMPQLGTGPMPRPDTGAVPRPGTGPMPRSGNGQGPVNGTGPMPRPGTGPMPRAGSGPVPRLDSGPLPRLGTGPMPRSGNGQGPRNGAGPMPRAGSGPVPRLDSGPLPRLGTGPMPQLGSGPMPRPDTGAVPRPGTGPMPRSGNGQGPVNGTGPMPRAGTGPMPRQDTGSMPRPGTGPLPRPGQPMPSADQAAGPRTGPLPRAADRPSRRAKSTDPRYRDVPGPTGGDEWE
jgi:hypothetical protein